MTHLLLGLTVVALAAGVLAALRIREERRIAELGRSLEAGSPPGVARDGGGGDAPDAAEVMPSDGPGFDPGELEGLPEPARRHLRNVLAPGTPPASSVRLRLTGSIRLERGGAPLPMESEEVLAPRRGFAWTARARTGPVTVRGFDAFADGEGESRWWLAGLVPVARADGPGVSRSAAGRLAGESALFVPSVLLPSRGARWEAVDEGTARVRPGAGLRETELMLDVHDDGRLTKMSFLRWNADPSNGPVGRLPFVVDGLGAERTFDGRTIPARFRAGWRLGEPEAFPFFSAEISAAQYRCP